MENRASQGSLDLGSALYHYPYFNSLLVVPACYTLPSNACELHPAQANEMKSNLFNWGWLLCRSQWWKDFRASDLFVPAGKEGIQRGARRQGEFIQHACPLSLQSEKICLIIYMIKWKKWSDSDKNIYIFFLGRTRRDGTNRTTRTDSEWGLHNIQ